VRNNCAVGFGGSDSGGNFPRGKRPGFWKNLPENFDPLNFGPVSLPCFRRGHPGHPLVELPTFRTVVLLISPTVVSAAPLGVLPVSLAVSDFNHWLALVTVYKLRHSVDLVKFDLS